LPSAGATFVTKSSQKFRGPRFPPEADPPLAGALIQLINFNKYTFGLNVGPRTPCCQKIWTSL